IPVYRGCAEPLLGAVLEASHFHGEDGLGDAPDPQAPGLDGLQPGGAVEAIIRLVNENPGEVHLVATGPLTNLALAVKLDPALPDKLKALFIMGGNIESRGNKTVCGEFNFVADPEAAFIVLTRFRCRTFIASWEFCARSQLPWVVVTVELEGVNTRGMMVLDYMELLKHKHKATLMKTIDLEKFGEMMMNALK
ncbi:hypothetical protein CRUP_011994, partial [Coryphaenoides rupestris]